MSKVVVVVGAGITGCLAAYRLSQAGCSVRLLDPSGIGEKATRYNPGGLNPLHGPGIPGVLSELALESYHLHQAMQPEICAGSSIDFHGRLVSRLELGFTEAEVADLERAEVLYNQTPGFSAEWVDVADLNIGGARLAAGVSRALMTHGNGMVDSYRYVQAIAECAFKLGVELIRREATGVVTDGEQICGVNTADGVVDCEAVVFATGAWFRGPSEWLGVSLPVEPLKGQLLVARFPWGQLPFHVMRGMTGMYETPGGEVWMGGTQENVGYDLEPTAEGRETILSALSAIFPDIREVDIVEQVAGFRPATPDRLPILGVIPGYSNAYISSGGGVKGMLLSAGMAKSVTDWVLGKNEPAFLSPFSPARFA